MNEHLLKKHDVMISYSTKTKEIADDVRQNLIEEGYSVWMAPESIPAGESYDNEIYAAIENAELVLFLMSEASISSRWCRAELKYAANTNKRILPARIDDIENPYEKLGEISCVLGKKQIFDMFPEYRRKLDSVVEKVNYLLTSEEHIQHPYPVISAEMQDLENSCIGRVKEIADINDLLGNCSFLNIYGFGGMGKTSIIKKFFSEYFLSLPYITIHVAKYAHSALETIAQIPFVGFNEREYLNTLRDESITKQEALFEKKSELLGNLGTSCLLIIDGMDYADQKEIEKLSQLKCDKIVVSRNRYDGLHAYEIQAMRDEDLFRFFDGVPQVNEQIDAVKAILEKVGRHTLTVSLISSYCREFEFSPQEILDEGVCEDLQKYDSDAGKISDILDKITLTEKEIYCLKILSLFPNGISKGKLQKTDKEVVRIAQSLVKKSLIITSSSTFQLHQILRELVYDKYNLDVNTLSPFLDIFLDIMRKLDIDETDMYTIVNTMDKVLIGEGDLKIKLYHHIGNWVLDFAYLSLFHVNHDLYKNMGYQDIRNKRNLHFDRFMYAYDLQSRALQLAENSDTVYAKRIRAHIISLMGACNYNMNNFQKAFEYQKQALATADLYLEEGSEWYQSILSRLGLTALAIGEWDVGLHCFNRMLEYGYKNEFKKVNKCSILYRLGVLYKHKQVPDKAIEYFQQAMQAGDNNSAFVESELYLNIAEMNLQLGNKDTAKNYYQTARKLRLALMETEDAAEAFIQTHDPLYA